MNRELELWNDKEITITLIVIGTVSTEGRDIWSKILGENQYNKTCKQVWLF